MLLYISASNSSFFPLTSNKLDSDMYVIGITSNITFKFEIQISSELAPKYFNHDATSLFCPNEKKLIDE